MDEDRVADLDHRRVGRRPAAELAGRAPRDAVLDPAERGDAEPGLADRGIGELRVLRAVRGFDRRPVGLVDAVAAPGGATVGERGELLRRGVAEVAEEVHRLVVAEHHHHPAARARRLLLQLLQAADDLERIRPPVGDVAELDKRAAPAGPAAARVGEAGGAGDRGPGRIIAVEVADRDDARRLGRHGRRRAGDGQKGEQQRRRPDDPMEQGSPLHETKGQCVTARQEWQCPVPGRDPDRVRGGQRRFRLKSPLASTIYSQV